MSQSDYLTVCVNGVSDDVILKSKQWSNNEYLKIAVTTRERIDFVLLVKHDGRQRSNKQNNNNKVKTNKKVDTKRLFQIPVDKVRHKKTTCILILRLNYLRRAST